MITRATYESGVTIYIDDEQGEPMGYVPEHLWKSIVEQLQAKLKKHKEALEGIEAILKTFS